jgi:hypothetical protein
MGRADLIGSGGHQLVPARQPTRQHPVVDPETQPFATQHNGVVHVPARPKRKPGRKDFSNALSPKK